MVDALPRSIPLQIPPLENGDRLNRYEFERRYNAMPHLRKAELVVNRVVPFGLYTLNLIDAIANHMIHGA